MNRTHLEEEALPAVIKLFYERVRGDALLGPVFETTIHDWDDHHARLADFWSSVMLSTGRYKGNPVALHLRHANALTPEAFGRWLSLWAQTTEQLLPMPAAQGMQAKAARIAQSLQLAIQYRRPDAA